MSAYDMTPQAFFLDPCEFLGVDKPSDPEPYRFEPRRIRSDVTEEAAAPMGAIAQGLGGPGYRGKSSWTARR
jgi:hypothetical protein